MPIRNIFQYFFVRLSGCISQISIFMNSYVLRPLLGHGKAGKNYTYSIESEHSIHAISPVITLRPGLDISERSKEER